MSFRKRLTLIGFCAAIYLGIVIPGVTVDQAYAGCAGDCMTCHSELKDSKEHEALKTCIDCHEPSENNTSLKADKLLTLSPSADGCGEDCFQCHDQWPKDGYHAALETCQNCHDQS